MAKPNTTTATKATTTTATKAPALLALPAANVVAAPTGRSTLAMVCMPGTVYGIAVTHMGNTVTLPFTVPGKAGVPVPVTVASTNANWLGRNGAPLNVRVCTNNALAGSAVTVQPHKMGYKVNAYVPGNGCAVHAVALAIAPVASATATATAKA